MRISAPILVCFLSLAATACGGKYLQSPVLDAEAQIRRTHDTTAIVDLMEEYESALDALDVSAIRALVSSDYYENAGTTDTTRDDYGFDELEEMFLLLTEHVEDIDIDVQVRDVIVEGDDADVLFEYTYRTRYIVAEEAHWQTEREVNRFQLQREVDGWRIVSGL